MSYRILDNESLLRMPLHGWHLIEANAGSGKTYTLANLYLRHILQGRTPAEILVVTFTRAATAELQQRLQQRLHQALEHLHHGNGDESLAAIMANSHTDEENHALRLQLALNSMDEAQITTIHGFCAQVLRQLALETGQPPAAELRENDLLRQQAVRDCLRVHGTQTPSPDPLAWTVLQKLELTTPDKLQNALKPLLQPAPPTVTPLARDEQRLTVEVQAQLQTLQTHWKLAQTELRDQLLEHQGISRDKKKGLPVDDIQALWPRLEQWWQSPGLPIPEWVEQHCSHQALLSRHKPSSVRKGDVVDHPFPRAFDRLLPQARLLEQHAFLHIAQWVKTREEALKRQQDVQHHDDLLERLDQALSRPQEGARLARLLRRRFPVVMIDEFQDTDRLQYRIFSSIHPADTATPEEPSQNGTFVALIGDPKQSIYRFRGSDIHAYLHARQQVAAEHRWLLDTNWRSTAEMIDGINRVFTRHPKSWMFEPLQYHPSHAPEPPRAQALCLDGQAQAAIHCQYTGHGEKLGPDDETIAGITAWRIAEMLQQARAGRLTLDGKPLRADQIAILVRSNAQIHLMRQALAAWHLPAACQQRDNIWTSKEAQDMQRLLEALHEPDNRTRLRALLSAHFLALTPEEQWQWQQDDARWAELQQHAQQAHRLAIQRSFIAGFQHLFQSLQPVMGIQRLEQPARTLTNLLQLAELLQQDAHAGHRISGLLRLLQQRRQGTTLQAWEPRMEGEGELVQIMTIHKAKGLQFPVVFVPWLRLGKKQRGQQGIGVQWHEDGQTCWSLRQLADETRQQAAIAEDMAEDIRLAYVAMTRAECQLWLFWGPMGRSRPWDCQALNWLVFGTPTPEFEGDQQAREQMQAAWPELSLHTWPDKTPKPAPFETEPAPAQPLHAAAFSRRLERNWRWHSFSALTRGLSHDGSGRDLPADTTGLPLRWAFPAGAHAGNLLHELLERLDYRNDLQAQLQVQLPSLALRHNIPLEAMPENALALWLDEILRTPLGPDEPALRDLSAEHRLHEMPFKLACDRIDRQALAAEGLLPLRSSDTVWSGLMTGIIDLVYFWGQRWWIADFKSNHLGVGMDAYRPAALEQAMLDHHYPLQYHIYALALHRHLRQRLPGYDPKQHFGGVRYLFLRGMAGAESPGSGVYAATLDPQRLQWLDEQAFQWQRPEGTCNG